MVVKINGTPIDTARVLRFAPRKKDGLDFRDNEVCSLDELKWIQQRITAHAECMERVWTVDRMGWRFLLLRDAYGNVFPQCFAPLTGELEIPEQE